MFKLTEKDKWESTLISKKTKLQDIPKSLSNSMYIK